MRRLESVARSCWLGLSACAALAACSAVVEPDIGDLGPRPSVCRPGDANPFVCPDSAIVFQPCNEQGGYDPAPPCPPPGCSPGAVAKCRCPNGTATTRTCLAQGIWPSCTCPPAGTAGTQAPAPGG